MKATRKLIPAIAMLLISAVMMSTATFAWFSTNSEVYANGMTVTAKTDSTFLVIGTASTKNQNWTETQVNATTSTATLLPASYGGIENKAITWNTGIGTTASNGALKGEYKKITTGLTDYVLTNTFYIRVANNFQPAANLRLDSVSVTGAASNEDVDYNKTVSVVVQVRDSNTVATYRYSNDNKTLMFDKTAVLADEVTSTDEIIVDVFVYIDGDNALVTTANVTSLTNMKVDLKFAVGEIPTDSD